LQEEYEITIVLTEPESLGGVWWEDESNNSDEGQQTARYNQIYDVVKRSASDVKSKRDASILALYA